MTKTPRSLRSFRRPKSSGVSLTSRWNTPPSRKTPAKSASKRKLTPARRFSYIVGEGESCHTAQTRFLDLLQDTENDPDSRATRRRLQRRSRHKGVLQEIRGAVRRDSEGSREARRRKTRPSRKEFDRKERQHRGLRQEAHGPDRVPLLPPEEGLARRREGKGLGHWPARFSPATRATASTAITRTSSTTFSNHSFTTRSRPIVDTTPGANDSNAAFHS